MEVYPGSAATTWATPIHATLAEVRNALWPVGFLNMLSIVAQTYRSEDTSRTCVHKSQGWGKVYLRWEAVIHPLCIFLLSGQERELTLLTKAAGISRKSKETPTLERHNHFQAGCRSWHATLFPTYGFSPIRSLSFVQKSSFLHWFTDDIRQEPDTFLSCSLTHSKGSSNIISPFLVHEVLSALTPSCRLCKSGAN